MGTFSNTPAFHATPEEPLLVVLLDERLSPPKTPTPSRALPPPPSRERRGSLPPKKLCSYLLIQPDWARMSCGLVLSQCLAW